MTYLKKSQQRSVVKIVNAIVFVYQGIFPSQNRVCRFDPTCTHYLQEAIETHGAIKGSVLSALRLMACHPFSKRTTFDPVPR